MHTVGSLQVLFLQMFSAEQLNLLKQTAEELKMMNQQKDPGPQADTQQDMTSSQQAPPTGLMHYRDNQAPAVSSTYYIYAFGKFHFCCQKHFSSMLR